MRQISPNHLPTGVRAFRGALSGVFLVPTSVAILGTGEPLTLLQGIQFLLITGTTGTCLGAAFGVTVGRWEIQGRTTRLTVQGIHFGAIVGILAGAWVGYVKGKPYAAPGIFIGGPLGALLGGIAGWETPPNANVGDGSWPTDGVSDRDLDG